MNELDGCSAWTRADVNVQMPDRGNSMLVGSCDTNHVVAWFLVMVRRDCVAVGSELDGVAVRLDFDLGAAVTEVPDLFAGAENRCDRLAK